MERFRIRRAMIEAAQCGISIVAVVRETRVHCHAVPIAHHGIEQVVQSVPVLHATRRDTAERPLPYRPALFFEQGSGLGQGDLLSVPRNGHGPDHGAVVLRQLAQASLDGDVLFAEYP